MEHGLADESTEDHVMSIEVSDGVSDGVQENPVGRARESTSSDEGEEQLAYRITTWHCKLGSRTLIDTEREVNWKMSRQV